MIILFISFYSFVFVSLVKVKKAKFFKIFFCVTKNKKVVSTH